MKMGYKAKLHNNVKRTLRYLSKYLRKLLNIQCIAKDLRSLRPLYTILIKLSDRTSEVHKVNATIM